MSPVCPENTQDVGLGLEELKRYSASVASDSLKTRSSTRDGKSDVDINFVEDNLPPVDGGLRAWLFVLACSMMEALVWGEIDNSGLICVEMILINDRICRRIWGIPRLLQRT